MAQRKHLTKQERRRIKYFLDSGDSLHQIAKKLERHDSTISREILRHRVPRRIGCHGLAFNDCQNRSDCRYRYQCDFNCVDYRKEICPSLSKPPYVCNHCETRLGCTLEKYFYDDVFAHRQYQQTLSQSRTGIHISDEELSSLDAFLSHLIKNGQSIQHILQNNPTKISLSRRTLYNYIDAGLLSARNIDLPRKVRYRCKHSPSSPQKVTRSCRIGRSYHDFLIYKKAHPHCPVVQLDSVVGTKGGKVLLTIHFVECEFMLAFLRQKNTAHTVSDVIENLYARFDLITFRHLFPLVLVDNGCEFSDPDSLEKDKYNNIRTKVFYCNPFAPYQKGAAENNHMFIRRILPKGTSFDSFTQQDINLMMNHINSYSRKTLCGKTPYSIFHNLYGQEILDRFDASLIPPNEIILKPKLLHLSKDRFR